MIRPSRALEKARPHSDIYTCIKASSDDYAPPPPPPPPCAGHAVFRGHVLLLRGALYALWRQDELGLKDLQEVVNSHGLKKEVHNGKTVILLVIKSIVLRALAN